MLINFNYYLVFWRTAAKRLSSISKKCLTFSVEYNTVEINKLGYWDARADWQLI